MKITAHVRPTYDPGTPFWAVNVPDIPGLFTQAHHVHEIPDAVDDAARTLGHQDVEVTYVLELADALADKAEADRKFWNEMAAMGPPTPEEEAETAEWLNAPKGPLTDREKRRKALEDLSKAHPSHFPDDYLERLRLGLPQSYETEAHPETEQLVREHMERHRELLQRLEEAGD